MYPLTLLPQRAKKLIIKEERKRRQSGVSIRCPVRTGLSTVMARVWKNSESSLLNSEFRSQDLVESCVKVQAVQLLI